MKAARSLALVLFLLTTDFFFPTHIAFSQSAYTIRGQVLDETGGWVPGASVRLYSAQRVLNLRADGDGRFEFTNLVKGNYELMGSSAGFIQGTVDFEIAEKAPEPFLIILHVGTGARCTVVSLEEQSAEVVGPVGVDLSYEKRSGKSDLEGVVRDELGSRLSNVTLKLVRIGASHETTSNDKGEFSYAGLEPGKYILYSPLAGYWDAPQSVWVTSSNLARVIVTLGDKRRMPCIR
jgi:hypothetical protein